MLNKSVEFVKFCQVVNSSLQYFKSHWSDNVTQARALLIQWKKYLPNKIEHEAENIARN